MISTELTRMLGLRYPIVSAPMASVSGGWLAGAVSEAGGLGMIGVGSNTPTGWISEQAELASPKGAFGFGLMCWALERRPDLLDAVLAAQPSAVSLSFGDPAPYVERVRDAGATVFCQVQDAAGARRAIEGGVQVLVAQGTDAGGHTGEVGTLPLMQKVLRIGEASNLPVLAAGGIATGVGIAGVLAMGAAGAWIGTRFAATEEALGSDEAKRRILEADETSTVHTRVFDITQGIPWPEEFPGRALRNAFTEKWRGRERELEENLPAARAELDEARERGDYSQMYVYAGQAAGMVEEVPPAGELVKKLAEDAERQLRRCCDSVLGPSL